MNENHQKCPIKNRAKMCFAILVRLCDCSQFRQLDKKRKKTLCSVRLRDQIQFRLLAKKRIKTLRSVRLRDCVLLRLLDKIRIKTLRSVNPLGLPSSTLEKWDFFQWFSYSVWYTLLLMIACYLEEKHNKKLFAVSQQLGEKSPGSCLCF